MVDNNSPTVVRGDRIEWRKGQKDKKKMIELGIKSNRMEKNECALAFKKGEVIEI